MSFIPFGPLLLCFFVFASLALGRPSTPSETYRAQAAAMHGKPKYPADFKNFDWVNPRAPKGGRLKLSAVGTCDSFNSLTVKGNLCRGVYLLFERLMVAGEDEPFTMYGLLAEEIEFPPNRSWVRFHLRKEARWNDGKPVTADDVIFSFKTLVKNNPNYKGYYSDVKEVVRIDTHTVHFQFKPTQNRELPLILGQLTIHPKHFWEGKDPAKVSLIPPLGSGPFKIKSFEPGRSMVIERVKNHWAENLPVRRGMYNFDEIQWEYYLDANVAFEAFKAGEYDMRWETQAKRWKTAYTFDAIEKGDVLKLRTSNHHPSGLYGFLFNTRRAIFKDIRVREALSLVFNFEWTNRTIFFDLYSRTSSFWDNSELASKGLPGPDELVFLNPLRDEIDPGVFTTVFTPAKNSNPQEIRANIEKALGLLQAAGWELRGGKLFNTKTKKPFRFDILTSSPGIERIAVPYSKMLQRVGIEARVRPVDQSQYINRLRQFNFDMIYSGTGQSLSPGNEQRFLFSSEYAKKPASQNRAGVQNKAIDQIIETLIQARSRTELVTLTKVLDRLVLHGHYVVPGWYYGFFRAAHWDRFGRPEPHPLVGIRPAKTWWYDPSKPLNSDLEGGKH